MLENVRKVIYDSLVNFGITIKNLYVKKGNIVNNLLSEDTDKPLAANQGRVLKENDNKITNQLCKIFGVPANSSIELRIPNQNHLLLFYTHHVIPSYKSITFASAGNGNCINSGQKTTLFKVVESQTVTLEVNNVSGYYNNVIVTNNGVYGVELICTVFGGTPPILINQ